MAAEKSRRQTRNEAYRLITKARADLADALEILAMLPSFGQKGIPVSAEVRNAILALDRASQTVNEV
jgi:hypothetical protein